MVLWSSNLFDDVIIRKEKIMNNTNIPTEEVVDLSPFKRMVMTIGTLPTAFTESMTYYEALAYFVKEIEQIIHAVNQNAEATKELQTLYTQLKQYVDDYFDNLDVQEEINNKLDEMAEQGELADIIAQYLQLAGVLAYDTKASMKTAVNLTNGSICKTLGDNNIQDGKGSFYKVRQIQNTDIIDEENIIALSDNNLVAEKIKDNKDVKVNSNIQLTLLGRTLHKNGITNQRDYDATTHYFSMSQGGCAINENIYAVCYIETNDALKNDNMAKLDLIDLRNGTVTDTVTFEGGHCNKVFYNPETEKLYTVDCYYLNSGNMVLTSNIHEFDVNDLSVNRLIQPSITDDDNNPMNHFEYDKVTGKYYALSLINDDEDIQINEIDFTDFTTIRKFYIENYRKYNKNDGVIFQNCVINNNRIYICLTGAQNIKVYDMNGSLIEILNLPKTIDSVYRNSELEGFSIVGNRFYCNAWDNVNNLRNSINTFYTFSLDENSPKTENEYFSSSLTIYVDKEANIWNPRGSQSLPFTELYELQQYLQSEELQGTTVTISLKENASPDEYDRFDISPNTSVIIEANNNKLSPNVSGKLTLYKAKIYRSNPNDVPFYIQTAGNVKMFECTFEEQFVSNIIITNYGTLLFGDNNQYTLTDTSKILINLAFGGTLITNLDIAQLNFGSGQTYLMNDKYKINKTEINSNAIAAFDYNDFMTSNNLNPLSSNFNRFKKFIVEYSFVDSGLRCYKAVNKRDYINISDTNMSDSGTTYMNIYEMTIQFTAYHINILHNKSYDLLTNTWDTTTQLMKLQNIWLAN